MLLRTSSSTPKRYIDFFHSYINNGNDSVLSLYQSLDSVLARHSLSSDIALIQTELISFNMQNSVIYVPTAKSVFAQLDIWSEFNGANVEQLATKYSCTCMNIINSSERIAKKLKGTSSYRDSLSSTVVKEYKLLFPKNACLFFDFVLFCGKKHNLDDFIIFEQFKSLTLSIGGSSKFYLPKRESGRLRNYDE
ncbi:Mor transcription activator family protein [Vibrio parahaemolyticus]|uniref:Mor transcription activator family protein n=1 Tax=Vibrio parahaemolyticus TaxID=670 RepID=UPI0038922682